MATLFKIEKEIDGMKNVRKRWMSRITTIF